MAGSRKRSRTLRLFITQDNEKILEKWAQDTENCAQVFRRLLILMQEYPPEFFKRDQAFYPIVPRRLATYYQGNNYDFRLSPEAVEHIDRLAAGSGLQYIADKCNHIMSLIPQLPRDHQIDTPEQLFAVIEQNFNSPVRNVFLIQRLLDLIWGRAAFSRVQSLLISLHDERKIEFISKQQHQEKCNMVREDGRVITATAFAILPAPIPEPRDLI